MPGGWGYSFGVVWQYDCYEFRVKILSIRAHSVFRGRTSTG